MRLWHEDLIPHLPRQQLLGQHRECCALRGLGWGRSHSTVNYVFDHSPMWLVAYHYKVLNEMYRRGYNYDENWDNKFFRGYSCRPYAESLELSVEFHKAYALRNRVYPEHNEEYYKECLDNLARKGINLGEYLGRTE